MIINIKKHLKRVLSLSCILLLLLQPCGTALTGIEDTVFDLTSLGAFDGIDVLSKDANSLVTRAEFAKMTVNLLGFSDLPQNSYYAFGDIAQSPYAQAINILHQLNIVQGATESNFLPENNIKLSESCIILLKSMGYSHLLDEQTYDAYINKAALLGITRGLSSTDEYLTFEQVVVLLKNAIDIDLVSISISGGRTSYTIEAGNTLRNALMGMEADGLVKKTGIVTADIRSYLYLPVSSLKSTQIEIEGVVYNAADEVPLDYVGMLIDFYVDDTDSGNVIVSFKASNKNTVTNIDSRNIDDVRSGRLSYYEGEKERTVTISSAAKYIYNGRVEHDYAVQNLLTLKNGSVRLIDNDGDHAADVVVIEEYVDCIVDRVYSETQKIIFKKGYTYNNEVSIELNTQSTDYYTNLLGADMQNAVFEDIEKADVLSIAKSRNGEALRVVISRERASGTVSEIGSEYIVIGGNEYEYLLPQDAAIGDMVIGYLNFRGLLVYSDIDAEAQKYAYVYATEGVKGLSGNVKIRLLSAGPVSVKYTETQSDDGAAATRTPKLFARNNEVLDILLSSTLSLDGTKKTAAEAASIIKDTVISYETDEQGNIKKVTTLSPAGSDGKRTYNSHEMTFGKSNGNAYGIGENASRSICIPTNSGASVDDLKVYVELVNNIEYPVEPYDIDEGTQIAGLIVMRMEMRAGSTGIVTTDSPVGLVSSVGKRVDEKTGEVRIIIDMVTKDGKQSMIVSNLISNENTFENISSGDLIAYSLDRADELNGFLMLQAENNYYGFLANASTENEKFCGTVENIIYNYVSNKKNRWVDRIDVGIPGEGTVLTGYELTQKSPAPVFVLDRDNEPQLSGFDNISPGDTVFVSSNLGNVRAIVIKRWEHSC